MTSSNPPELGTPQVLPPEADRVVVSCNPKAGRRSPDERVRRLAQGLEEIGYSVDVSHDLDEVTAQAIEAFRHGRLRALVAVGGDGTLAELVNRTPNGLPIASLPMGTSNLLARYLGLSSRPEVLARTIAGGAVVKMDAGLANGRVFLMMAGCGFDAEVVEGVDRRRRASASGHIGFHSYLRPIWQASRTYE